MEAIKEVGVAKLVKFVLYELWLSGFSLMFLPPLRVWWLRLGGASIGEHVVIHRIRLVNLYAKGLAGISIGDACFLGDDVLLDCAERILIENDVTIAMRTIVVTHMNVGYRSHPLQKRFPRRAKPVIIRKGSFIGANVTILPGVTIGSRSFVGAGAVIAKNIPARSLVRGMPAKVVGTTR